MTSSLQSSGLAFEFHGLLPYAEARSVQEDLISRRAAGQIPDTIIFCEHPPVISCGWRTTDDHFVAPVEEIEKQDIELVRTDRGGAATYHGPGQLVIYPVVSLRERRLGVRKFVELMLSEISRAVRESAQLETSIELEPAGIWYRGAGHAFPGAKLGSVGLKIVHGVTNHGFSLNVGGDLSPFNYFSACGLPNLPVTSMSAILGREIKLSAVAKKLADNLDGSPEFARVTRGEAVCCDLKHFALEQHGLF